MKNYRQCLVRITRNITKFSKSPVGESYRMQLFTDNILNRCSENSRKLHREIHQPGAVVAVIQLL